MPLDWVLFAVLAGVIAVSAVGVALSQSIIRSAVWLLFTLLGVSLLYFLLGAPFLGATQLIVYVGGTLVLLVFGAMLTGGGPFHKLSSRPVEWLGGVVVAAGLFCALASASFKFGGGTHPTSEEGVTTGQLGLTFLGVPDMKPKENNRVLVGPSYLLPFEIVSVHLLVVLVGAAYLARAKKRFGQKGDVSP